MKIKDWYNRKEVVEIFGISQRTLTQWHRKGHLSPRNNMPGYKKNVQFYSRASLIQIIDDYINFKICIHQFSHTTACKLLKIEDVSEKILRAKVNALIKG